MIVFENHPFKVFTIKNQMTGFLCSGTNGLFLAPALVQRQRKLQKLSILCIGTSFGPWLLRVIRFLVLVASGDR